MIPWLQVRQVSPFRLLLAAVPRDPQAKRLLGGNRPSTESMVHGTAFKFHQGIVRSVDGKDGYRTRRLEPGRNRLSNPAADRCDGGDPVRQARAKKVAEDRP